MKSIAIGVGLLLAQSTPPAALVPIYPGASAVRGHPTTCGETLHFNSADQADKIIAWYGQWAQSKGMTFKEKSGSAKEVLIANFVNDRTRAATQVMVFSNNPSNKLAVVYDLGKGKAGCG